LFSSRTDINVSEGPYERLRNNVVGQRYALQENSYGFLVGLQSHVELK